MLAGSGELWNAARSVTILGRLPKDESITYVTQEKLNVGTKARSILFRTQTVSVKNKAGAEVETVRAVLAATTEKQLQGVDGRQADAAGTVTAGCQGVHHGPSERAGTDGWYGSEKLVMDDRMQQTHR